MKYFIIATIISIEGAIVLKLTAGSSWIGAALIAGPWICLPVVTFIEKRLKK
jgi:hypothetical protein